MSSSCELSIGCPSGPMREKLKVSKPQFLRRGRDDVHKNARLTAFGRERIVGQVLGGETPKATSQVAGVCPRTVRKWVKRYELEGVGGLQDRTSRPHRLFRPTHKRWWTRSRRRQRLTGKAIAITVGYRQPQPDFEAAWPEQAQRSGTWRSVMTDNGSCYRSKAFAKACKRLGLKHIRTRPYTPKTNGKAERFIQTKLT